MMSNKFIPRGSVFPRGRSFQPAQSDSAPASHTVVVQRSGARFPAWVPGPDCGTTPDDAYQYLKAKLRGNLSLEMLTTQAVAVGQGGLSSQGHRADQVHCDFGGGPLAGFKRWLSQRGVSMASATTLPQTSLYDAFSMVLFGPDSAEGPKLRWLAVQHMRLNQGAFLQDARNAGRNFEDFLEAHKRGSEPGTAATLRALADCLGVEVHVASCSCRGEVNLEKYRTNISGDPTSAGQAAAPPLVYLCARPSSSAATAAVQYDILDPLPQAPAPGSRRSAAEAGLPAVPPAPPAPAHRISVPSAPAAVEEDGPDRDEEVAVNVEVLRLTKALGGASLQLLDFNAWEHVMAHGSGSAVHLLLDGVKVMLDRYRGTHQTGVTMGRGRAEALRALDDAVAGAEKALLKAEEEACVLADTNRVLVVGEEGAGKSSLVNRVVLHSLVSSEELARINGAGPGARDGANLVKEVRTPWDAAPLDPLWFSEEAGARSNKQYNDAVLVVSKTAVPSICPTGNLGTTTAMCTTVVLAPGLQPRLVLKYKSAADLIKLRSHVDEIRTYDWRVSRNDPSDDDDDDSQGLSPEAPRGVESTTPAPLDAAMSGDSPGGPGDATDDADEPENFNYWADYAVAAFGISLNSATTDEDGSGVPRHVLRVHSLTNDDLVLPESFRNLLGTTSTLRFLHTDRIGLVEAVAAELKRRTLGSWSHWGLLESVRLYLPSNHLTVSLVDVPGYSPSLSPFLKESQDWAFRVGGFSTLMQCIKPRFQFKTIPPQMLQNELFRARVLSPLVNEGAKVNFHVIPVYCLDNGIAHTMLDAESREFVSLDHAVAVTSKLVNEGSIAVNDYWRVGIKEYLDQTLPEGATRKLHSKLVANMASCIQPRVINSTPSIYEKVLEGVREEPSAVQLRQWDTSLTELTETLTQNSCYFSNRVAARALETLMASSAVPLLRSLAQLQGFRNLERDAPGVLAALNARITPDYRAKVQRELAAHLNSKYDENEKGRVDGVRNASSAATRALQDSCKGAGVITARFKHPDFHLYNRKGSRQLRPDIKSDFPHSASSGLLKRLLLGNECERAVTTIAAESVGKLGKLFFHAARAQNTYESVAEVLGTLLKSKLQSSDDAATNAKLSRLVTCTEDLFRDSLSVVLNSVRDEAIAALSPAALTQRLEVADDSILASVLVSSLVGLDTAKVKTNVKRVEAMAGIVQKAAAANVANELHALVMSVLQQLENNFKVRVASACDELVYKLQTLDAAGLRNLAADKDKALERSNYLFGHLCHLVAAVSRRIAATKWLGDDAEASLARLRFTPDLVDMVDEGANGGTALSLAPPAAVHFPDGVHLVECPRCRWSDFGRGSFVVSNTRGDQCLVCYSCFMKIAEEWT